MYIRIESGVITFRLSRVEADGLLQSESISDSVWLTAETELSYQVAKSESSSECVYTKEDNMLNLLINHSELKQELSERPSKAGIEVPFISNPQATKVYLQIDLKKIKPKN